MFTRYSSQVNVEIDTALDYNHAAHVYAEFVASFICTTNGYISAFAQI